MTAYLGTSKLSSIFDELELIAEKQAAAESDKIIPFHGAQSYVDSLFSTLKPIDYGRGETAKSISERMADNYISLVNEGGLPQDVGDYGFNMTIIGKLSDVRIASRKAMSTIKDEISGYSLTQARVFYTQNRQGDFTILYTNTSDRFRDVEFLINRLRLVLCSHMPKGTRIVLERQFILPRIDADMFTAAIENAIYNNDNREYDVRDTIIGNQAQYVMSVCPRLCSTAKEMISSSLRQLISYCPERPRFTDTWESTQ